MWIYHLFSKQLPCFHGTNKQCTDNKQRSDDLHFNHNNELEGYTAEMVLYRNPVYRTLLSTGITDTLEYI